MTRSSRLVVALAMGVTLALSEPAQVQAAAPQPAAASPAPAGRTPEQILQDSVAILNELADAMATIKDAASGRAAAPRIKSLADRAKRLQQDQRQMDLRSGGLDPARAQQYQQQISAAISRIMTEGARLDRLPGKPPRELIDAVNSFRDGQSPGGGGSSSAPDAPGTWAFLYPLMLVFIFLGSIGALFAEGMWSNAVRLVNVVTAGLLAVNFWEPIARWLEGQMPTFTYYVDLMALWGLFVVFMLVFRLLTGALSRVKVKFLKIADRVGSVVFAAWVGWVMVCFTVFSLHTAPLSRNFLFGGFDPDKRMFMLAPDRQWLGFSMKVSRGTFCRYGSEQESQQGTYGWEADPSSQDQKLCVFDREARFIPKYAARRAALEKIVSEKQATRVESGGSPKR